MVKISEIFVHVVCERPLITFVNIQIVLNLDWIASSHVLSEIKTCEHFFHTVQNSHDYESLMHGSKNNFPFSYFFWIKFTFSCLRRVASPEI